MLKDNNTAVFSKNGITLQIPENITEKFNISDNDSFGVEIFKTENDSVCVKVYLNDNEITEIKGMKLIVPYDYTSGDITVENVNDKTTLSGSYDKSSKTVSFITDNTGVFRISSVAAVNNDIGANESAENADNSSDNSTLFAVLAVISGAVVIAAILAVILIKRRKNT